MASLMELIERVNKGEMIDPTQLEVYQDSSNSAEKFLAHHARAMLDLRQAQQHMMQSLEAIDPRADRSPGAAGCQVRGGRHRTQGICAGSGGDPERREL